MIGPYYVAIQISRFAWFLGGVGGNLEEDVEEGGPGSQKESHIEERLNHPNVLLLLILLLLILNLSHNSPP